MRSLEVTRRIKDGFMSFIIGDDDLRTNEGFSTIEDDALCTSVDELSKAKSSERGQ
jgi:hypothetical protein